MTTTKGRIVYRRAPHLFTYRDVNRIVRQVRPKREEAADVYFTMLRAVEDLSSIVGDNLEWLTTRRTGKPMNVKQIVTLIGFVFGVVASLGEESLALLRGQGGKLLGQLLFLWNQGAIKDTASQLLIEEALNGSRES